MTQSSRSIISQARALWRSVWTDDSEKPSPAEFQSRFDALYNATSSPTALWQLGGAANDYLRGHPGAIKVPVELAPLLLKSRIVDGRVIGLKLLTRTSSNVAEICEAICSALDRRSEYERCGGLHELGVLHDRIRSHLDCGHSPLPRSSQLPKQEIIKRLQRIEKSSVDYNRESATRLIVWIQEL